MSSDLLRDFRQAVHDPDEKIDLGRAALAIARDDYPAMDIGLYLARIDKLGAAVWNRMGEDPSPYCAIAALNTVLFKEQGFQGNRQDYYDPKNSFLNEVMDRKKGIPITLSVLYMEVARRVGLPLYGVGFPAHFLVKYRGPDEEIVIDPFNGGEIKPVESLEKLLHELYGGRLRFHPDLLAPVTKKQILKRMLTNLKVIYLREKDLMKGLSVLERLVILDPTSAEDLRDRGLIYLNLECFKQSLADLESYLSIAPDANDAGAVREQVVALTRQVTQIH